MTERQDVAAVPAPWPGASGPLPAAQGGVGPTSGPLAAGSAASAGAAPGGEAYPGGGRAQQANGDQGRGQPGSFGPAQPGSPAAPAGFRGASAAGSPPTWQFRTGGLDPAWADETDDEPYARVDARRLEDALIGLRKPLVSVPFRLEAPGVEQARAERLKLLSQIDDYLLPRLRQSGAPILVALVGSTGAGKSTLMNSLVGRQVSATGIRRPTTNSPVLACNPNDMRWFAENVFLPTLPRVRQQGLAMPGRDGLLVLAASEGMPEGVAVLDTPDIDSVVKAHSDFAHQFLDASDLWLFVTTARRYADAAVWEMLKDARDRGAALAIALSRVPPASAPQLAAHFDAMLEANGLREVRRFIIPETLVTDAQLPPAIAAPFKEYLADTARRDDRRVAVLTQTMAGVLDTFRDRVPALADEAEAQLVIEHELRESVDAAYEEGLREFDQATTNGSVLSGEVLARWQDFAGTGDLQRTLQVRRGRSQSARPKKQRLPARAAALKAALHISLESLVIATADRAAEHAISAWQANQAGAALLAAVAAAALPASANGQSESDFVASALADLGLLTGADAADQLDPAALSRASAGLSVHAARAISAWQEHVLHLVREENVTKRSIARVVSFDEESLALVLAMAVLGYGTSGGAGPQDPAGVPQRLLTSLFGAGQLRDIGVRVRQDLHARVRLLFEEETTRFADLLKSAGAPDQSYGAALLQAGYSLESAR